VSRPRFEPNTYRVRVRYLTSSVRWRLKIFFFSENISWYCKDEFRKLLYFYMLREIQQCSHDTFFTYSLPIICNLNFYNSKPCIWAITAHWLTRMQIHHRGIPIFTWNILVCFQLRYPHRNAKYAILSSCMQSDRQNMNSLCTFACSLQLKRAYSFRVKWILFGFIINDNKTENLSGDDVVDIGTRLWAGLSGVLFPARSVRLWDQPSLLSRCRGFLAGRESGGKGARREAEHSRASLTGVCNDCSYASTTLSVAKTM